MTSIPVAQHPASVEAYIRHGWSLVPVPAGTKGPQHQGWNKRENALNSQTQLPQGWGIGLAHAYSGTMALDIDEWGTTAFELFMNGIDLNALYDAPDAVIVDSGRAGRGKLLYAMPFGLVLPSKKIVRNNVTLYELRCGTSNGLTVQDILPPTIHPSTNQPYRWAGKGHWTRLPVIPMSLLKLWNSMLVVQSQPQVEAPVDANWDEIRSAIAHITPDCSREEWITVGMALHHAGSSTGHDEYARTLWDEWSRPSDKYPGEKELTTQWRSFRNDKATKVRLGSLFKIAKGAGWTGTQLDASKLFTGVEMATPAQITSSLRPPPPQLDMDLVPAALRDYAMKVSVGVGCDPMIPLFGGVAAISGAIDGRTRLELKPEWKVPPVIWVMTVGEPAGKKTHGASPMFEILETLEKEDRPNYARQMQMFEAAEARHEMSRKAFLDAAKDTDALLSGEVPHGYGDAPTKPVPLKILTDDFTTQQLVRQAAERPRGMLAYQDEMYKFASDMTDKNSGQNRSAWTRAYEAKRYEMDRVGAGTINCENFAVSFYGNIQPDGLSKLMPAMAMDGMIQRYIPVMVQSEMSHKGRPDRDQTAKNAYEVMTRTVFGLPALTYKLGADATLVFDEFQDWYYKKLEDERLLKPGPIFMTAFGKMEGLVGRIALLWHSMSNPFSIEVSAETMRQAVEVVRSYIIPSMRYIYEDESTAFDEWCAKYVIQYADQPSLRMSEVRRSARRQLEGISHWGQIDKIVAAMHVLESAKWVARTDDGSVRDSATWAINPNIQVMFADHRRKTLEAKQRQLDDIYRLSTKPKPKVHGYVEAA